MNFIYLQTFINAFVFSFLPNFINLFSSSLHCSYSFILIVINFFAAFQYVIVLIIPGLIILRRIISQRGFIENVFIISIFLGTVILTYYFSTGFTNIFTEFFNFFNISISRPQYLGPPHLKSKIPYISFNNINPHDSVSLILKSLFYKLNIFLIDLFYFLPSILQIIPIIIFNFLAYLINVIIDLYLGFNFLILKIINPVFNIIIVFKTFLLFFPTQIYITVILFFKNISFLISSLYNLLVLIVPFLKIFFILFVFVTDCIIDLLKVIMFFLNILTYIFRYYL